MLLNDSRLFQAPLELRLECIWCHGSWVPRIHSGYGNTQSSHYSKELGNKSGSWVRKRNQRYHAQQLTRLLMESSWIKSVKYCTWLSFLYLCMFWGLTEITGIKCLYHISTYQNTTSELDVLAHNCNPSTWTTVVAWQHSKFQAGLR